MESLFWDESVHIHEKLRKQVFWPKLSHWVLKLNGDVLEPNVIKKNSNMTDINQAWLAFQAVEHNSLKEVATCY